MTHEQKLYAAVGAALVIGGLVWWAKSDEKEQAQAHTPTEAANLPQVKMAKDATAKVTRLVVSHKGDEITVEKQGDTWKITKPFSAVANQANVKAAIENLEVINVTALIAETAEVYDKYELTDQKAVHVQVFKGDEKALDLFFGKSGGRGHMMRIAGAEKPTVYATKGYSPYLWGREIKNWRNNEVLKFEDANAVAVELENEHGKFSFTKADDKWVPKFYKRGDDGALAAKPADIEDFDDDSVLVLLRAFKAVKSTDFADADDDTGLDDAVKHGALIKITMKDEDKPKHVIHLGKTAMGANRYIKTDGDDTVYVVTSYAADWAKVELKKFQVDKDKDKKGDDKDKKGDDKDKKGDDKDKKGKDAKKDVKPKPTKPKPAPAP